MLRAALTALTTLAALPAAALCSGESYLSQLDRSTQAEIAASVDATPYSDGLLWTLTRGADTLTVVGTMHVYDERLDAIRDKVAPVLKSADLLMVEATADEEAEMQQALIANPDLLGAKDWAKVQKAAEERGLPSFLVSKFQPWYLSLSLGVPACAMGELAAGKRGLDHMLSAVAEDTRVPMQALEGWEVLIEVLTDGDMDDQIDMLKLGLLSSDAQSALFIAMLDAYFSEQIAIVWEVSEVAARELSGLSAEDAAAQMDETQELLLDKRNRNWVPVIEAATARNDDIVIAVGAAHLPGTAGLLALLEAEGWTLTRIQ